MGMSLVKLNSSETPLVHQPSTSETATTAPPAQAQGNHPALALTVIALAQLMIVLDVTIVNVSLPHVQRALGFSGNGLEWVVNAYALTFGGLLLLGGRAGDIMGRRPVFVAGVLLFSGASLAAGLATSQWWLIAARSAQGAGAAVIAPTALSLLITTFAEGPSRNKAMGIFAAVNAAGGAVGLLLGGVLTTYANWRWVFFVNVPVGVLLAILAPGVFAASKRLTGRFDLPGALSGALGLALLVFGISHAATDQSGVSHWGDAATIGTLAAAGLLLVTFVIIEWRTSHPLMPLRIFADRNRSGAYLIVLCVVTAMFSIFFFLTVFMQTVWGYSALKAGAAYLPMALAVVAVATLSSQLVERLGTRPLLLAGTLLVAGGMFWLSRSLTAQGYASDVLGPIPRHQVVVLPKAARVAGRVAAGLKLENESPPLDTRSLVKRIVVVGEQPLHDVRKSTIHESPFQESDPFPGQTLGDQLQAVQETPPIGLIPTARSVLVNDPPGPRRH